MVEFCPRCGSVMVPRVVNGKKVLVCPRCGYVKETNSGSNAIISRRIKHDEREKTFVIDSKDSLKGLPKTKGVRCPKCGYDEAYYIILQTRSADEPPTRIYICARCGYTWREYE
jgi:DNA-directed RNA polymerase subunit M